MNPTVFGGLWGPEPLCLDTQTWLFLASAYAVGALAYRLVWKLFERPPFTYCENPRVQFVPQGQTQTPQQPQQPQQSQPPQQP